MELSDGFKLQYDLSVHHDVRKVRPDVLPLVAEVIHLLTGISFRPNRLVGILL